MNSSTEEMNWKMLAACKNEDVKIFFPIAVTKKNHRDFNKVVDLCTECQVSAKCLSEALRDDLDGIWARTTRRQRSIILQEIFQDDLDKISIPVCEQIVDHLKSKDIKLYTKNIFHSGTNN